MCPLRRTNGNARLRKWVSALFVPVSPSFLVSFFQDMKLVAKSCNFECGCDEARAAGFKQKSRNIEPHVVLPWISPIPILLCCELGSPSGLSLSGAVGAITFW